MSVHGLLLAAGAGTRMGTPKALVRDPDGTVWLHRSVDTLLAGGCDGVLVVLGAAADEAGDLLGRRYADEPRVRTVPAPDWAEGMSASLRAGLTALADLDDEDAPDAALVLLVDLPDLTPAVVRRVLGAAAGAAGGAGPAVLARATYAGRPGHPVLVGRAHWAALVAEVSGDRGARDYLAARTVTAVECGDLATGDDQDTPDPRDRP